MKAKSSNSGLRKHRPKKKFRFEYIKGKFSGMTKEGREIRLFSEFERDQFRFELLQEVLKEYWNNKNA